MADKFVAVVIVKIPPEVAVFVVFGSITMGKIAMLKDSHFSE